MKIYSPKAALQFPKVGRGIPSRSSEDQERLPTGTNDRTPSRFQYRDLHPAPIAGKRSQPFSSIGRSTRLPTREAGFPKTTRKRHSLTTWRCKFFISKRNVGHIIALKAQRIANVAVIYASSTTAVSRSMPETCKRFVGCHPEQILIGE
jgi:hypothetical protein